MSDKIVLFALFRVSKAIVNRLKRIPKVTQVEIKSCVKHKWHDVFSLIISSSRLRKYDIYLDDNVAVNSVFVTHVVASYLSATGFQLPSKMFDIIDLGFEIEKRKVYIPYEKIKEHNTGTKENYYTQQFYAKQRFIDKQNKRTIIKETASKLLECSSEEKQCRICFVYERTHCFVPCGHVVLCEICALKYQNKECPLCRTPYTQIMKTFF